MTPRVQLGWDKQFRWRLMTYLGLGVLCAGLLIFAGGSPWVSDGGFHTGMESVAMLLAAAVGALCLARYYSKRSNDLLFLGAGFLGTAALDAYHAVVTSAHVAPYLPTGIPGLAPWSWTASRTCLALFCFLACCVVGRYQQLISDRLVHTVGALTTLLLFAFFAFVPLPRAYYSEFLVHRPAELVPGVLFVLALVGHLGSGRWKKSLFDHWFFIFLVLNVMAQVLVMPFSAAVYDAPFNLAHLIKIGSYAAAFVALLTSVYSAFQLSEARSEELEDWVRMRTMDLEAANEALQLSKDVLIVQQSELARRNEELDQFAYIASHDLRAPLRAIDNLSSWIVEDAGDQLPEETQRHLRTLRGRVHRMDALLDDLLQFSRAGRRHAPVEEFDLVDAVDSALAVVQPPGAFSVRVSGDTTAHLETPRTPLEQILRNLVDNAIKHHDQEQGKIEITVAENGTMVELTVADDGPGIDPEFQERVFRMFHTLKPRDQVESTGMGLALVQRLVESYGGEIHLVSEGRGTKFEFTWPKHWVPPSDGNGHGVSPDKLETEGDIA